MVELCTLVKYPGGWEMPYFLAPFFVKKSRPDKSFKKGQEKSLKRLQTKKKKQLC